MWAGFGRCATARSALPPSRWSHTGCPRTCPPRCTTPALPPLPRMLFWAGYVTEQALVVNVRGFGLVLISGCGHPRIEQILGVTERVLDVPIKDVDGAGHLPAPPPGDPL